MATLVGSTRAYIGDHATVNARGNRDAATVYLGETVVTLYPDTPEGETPDKPTGLLDKKTELAKGLSVTAYNRENLITTVASGAGGGTAGVAATVSANVIATTADAHIGRGARINENNAGAGDEQQVRVKAVDETLLVTTAAGAGGGGTAGVGAAANVGVIAKTTKAWIGEPTVRTRINDGAAQLRLWTVAVSLAIGLGSSGQAAEVRSPADATPSSCRRWKNRGLKGPHVTNTRFFRSLSAADEGGKSLLRGESFSHRVKIFRPSLFFSCIWNYIA